MTDKEVERYIDQHTSDEKDFLYKLNRETNLKTTLPRMLSGKVQGKFLEMISLLIAPNRILEIGTFTGYSAMCLAAGLTENGRLITIESNIEMEEFIRTHFSDSGFDKKIELKIGDALKLLPTIQETFDLVFIDANKEEYLSYYNLTLPKVNKGGTILVDNVLWSGKVLNNKNPDRETRALQEFNKYVANDPKVEQVILSIRDGIMLIRKV